MRSGGGGLLLKFIHAHALREHQRDFAEGQRAWAALSGVPGFRGQVGGFTPDDGALVCGLWDDAAAYERFMRHDHDAIAARAAQQGTYDRLDIALFDRVLPMPGVYTELADAAPLATHLRWADCLVRPDRIESFVGQQQRVWQPGMAATGMLGGGFWRSRGTPERFLVLTLWPSDAVHARYQRDVLPSLRQTAGVDRDLDGICGGFIALRPDWTVTP